MDYIIDTLVDYIERGQTFFFCEQCINIIQDSLYLHVDCCCMAERKDHTGGKQPRCYIMNTASL